MIFCKRDSILFLKACQFSNWIVVLLLKEKINKLKIKMCSRDNEECDEIKSEILNNLPESEQGLCKKCEKPASINIRNVGTYCSDCLLIFVTHKFRGGLGKYKVVSKNEEVLLAFSGGQSSTLLLYLVKSRLNLTTSKRKVIKPTVLYIDESGLFDEDPVESESNLKKIIEIAKQFEFPTYVTSLATCLSKDDWENLDSLIKVENAEDYNTIFEDSWKIKLKELFDSIAQPTSKQDLLLLLRTEMLSIIAAKLKCTKIFVGDCQELLASRLLSDLALGRGQNLSHRIGLMDTRLKNVTLIRPLREISKKEVAFCINNLRLETVFQPSLSTKQESRASVQTLTEKFILDLQNKFPATVSTIFRTGEKLESNWEPQMLNENSCIICSEELSRNSCESQSYPKAACSNNCKCSSNAGNKNDTSLKLDELSYFCCYSCRLIIKDMTNIEVLPSHIREKFDKQVRRWQMKNQISEFLLDPESS